MRDKRLSPLTKYLQKQGGSVLERPKRKSPRILAARALPRDEKSLFGTSKTGHRAWALWRRFKNAKAARFGEQFDFLQADKKTVKAFVKLYRMLKHHAVRDVQHWFNGHFDFYGEFTFPNHLISDFSYTLYVRGSMTIYAESPVNPKDLVGLKPTARRKAAELLQEEYTR